jgi:glutamate/tyrosine decarboxylase-like PLP-dependent enzyme
VTDLRALLHAAADHGADYLETLDERPVHAPASYRDMAAAFTGDMPQHGVPSAAVLDDLVRRATPGLEGMASGRYFGFVIGGHLDAALAADMVTAAWDQNAGLSASTPAAAACEDVVGAQLASVLGLPPKLSFALVTGGMMANFTCLAAARHAALRAHGWDVERDGLQGAPRVRVVAGAERHSTIDRALRYLGIGTAAIELVDVDDQGAMRADVLDHMLAKDRRPTIVCTQAGNVNSGAFDPFAQVCATAHAHDAWVHVDGAFGLWAGASASYRHLVTGVEQADSWATDAHKWLNVPYDCGISFTAHPADHAAALGFRAEYLVFTEGERDAMDFTPEASRRARAFPVWAALQSLGRDGIAELVERCCRRAQQFAELLIEVPGVEIANDVVLNQVVVRFPGRAGVVEAVQASGACVMTPTVWQGEPGMRISVSNWQTTEADVARSVAAIREVMARLQPTSST